jgi:chaperonin GroEL (HSP60 family)
MYDASDIIDDDPSTSSSTIEHPAIPAQALASTLGATLGPNGLDKMLIDRQGTVVITNTGATVLESLEVDDPIGRIVRDAVHAHAHRTGDGTTTTALLLGELLSEAETLVGGGLHPNTIVDGYGIALESAHNVLRELAVPVEASDHGTLQQIASTAITGKWDSAATARFATLTVDALCSVDFDVTRATLHAYPGATLADSEQVDGIFIDTETSSTAIDALETGRIRTDPTLAFVEAEIELPERDGSETVVVRDTEELQAVCEYEQERKDDVRDVVVDLDIDVLVCRQSIDDEIRTGLENAGVLAIERTRQDEFAAIARATDGESVASVRDLDRGDLGTAEAVRHRSIGGGDAVVFSGLPAEEHVSLVLRGGTQHVAEETRRIVEDCIAAVQHAADDGGVVPGGGAGMTAVARDVAARATRERRRTALAVDAFADATTVIPRALARNAGLDPIDAMAALRVRHNEGNSAVGIDRSGELRNMCEVGVVEPATVPIRCLETAFETASLLLRVDERLAATPDPDSDATGHGGHEHAGHEHERDSGHPGGYPWALSH